MKLESLSQLPGKEAKFKSERNNSNHETHHHLAKHPLMTSKTKPVKSIQTNNQTTPHLTSGHAGCWSAWVLTVSSSTEPHDGPGNMREENCEKTTLADLDWCQLMPADLICLHVLFNLFPNAHSVLAMPCDILCWIETSSRCNRRSSCCNANLARLFRSWKNSKQGYSNNGCLLFQLLTRIDLQHWASDRLRSSEIEEGLKIFARHRFRTGNAAQVCVFCRQYASCQPSHA